MTRSKRRNVVEDGRDVGIERVDIPTEMAVFGAAGVWGANFAADLRDFRAGRRAWCDIERGVLLSGPAGVGKSSFAAAIAAIAGVDLATVSARGPIGSGGPAAELQERFADWRRRGELRPLIALVEHADVIGRPSGGDERTCGGDVLLAWLGFLDAGRQRPGVVVMGTTEDPAPVCSALRRPGRLGYHLPMRLPDAPSLMALLRQHLDPGAEFRKAAHPAADLAAVADVLRGRSADSVEALCRSARRYARWCGRRVVPLDIVDALWMERAVRRPDEVASERRLAIHEAGYAIACLVTGTDTLVSVHLDGSRTEIAMEPWLTAEAVDSRLITLLAGRAAETLLLGEGSSASAHDLASATRLAVDAQRRWGFGVLGLRAVEGSIEERSAAAAASAMLDSAYERALTLLDARGGSVDRLARVLVERRCLDRDEVVALLDQPL